jgi:hypothetical protein
MTAPVRYLPNLADACDRMTARAKADNIARETGQAIARAKLIMDNPRGYTDSQVETACGWFMRQSNAARDDDGNVYYQRADELLYSIHLRQRSAINRRQFLSHTDPDRPRPADHGAAKVIAVLVLAGCVGMIVGWILQRGWM